MMYTLAFLVFTLLLGFWSGYSIGKGSKKKVEAPAPDYDVGNPINARSHRGEVVEICGAEFVRVN